MPIEKLDTGRSGVPYILTVSKDYTYEETAEKINRNCERVQIAGVILQADEAVLVENRIDRRFQLWMR